MQNRRKTPAVIRSVRKDATAIQVPWIIPARLSVLTVRQQNANIIPIINAMRKLFPFKADMQGKADRRFVEPLNVKDDVEGMLFASLYILTMDKSRICFLEI